MRKITSNCDKGRPIKFANNFLFSINSGQFRQTFSGSYRFTCGSETTKLASKNEIGNSRCLTQLLEMNE